MNIYKKKLNKKNLKFFKNTFQIENIFLEDYYIFRYRNNSSLSFQA